MLTLIWVGVLEVCFEAGGEKVKLPSPSPCLKLVKIMPKAWNLIFQ